jgi:hypothetical protein
MNLNVRMHPLTSRRLQLASDEDSSSLQQTHITEGAVAPTNTTTSAATSAMCASPPSHVAGGPAHRVKLSLLSSSSSRLHPSPPAPEAARAPSSATTTAGSDRNDDGTRQNVGVEIVDVQRLSSSTSSTSFASSILERQRLSLMSASDVEEQFTRCIHLLNAALTAALTGGSRGLLAKPRTMSPQHQGALSSGGGDLSSKVVQRLRSETQRCAASTQKRGGGTATLMDIRPVILTVYADGITILDHNGIDAHRQIIEEYCCTDRRRCCFMGGKGPFPCRCLVSSRMS